MDSSPQESRPGDTAPSLVELGPCEVPSPLPEDPLVLVSELDVQEARGLSNVHIVDLEVEPTRQRAYGVGYRGFFIFDVSDEVPALVGGDGEPNELFRLEVLDADHVAVSTRERGFQIRDVRDVRNPEVLDQAELDGASGMALGDGLLYVVTHLGELVTYEVSPTWSLRELARMEGLSNAWEIVIEGDYAYVADNTLGVAVVDLSDPRTPSLVGVTETAAGLQDLEIGGGYLYAAVGGAGVEIFSLADPAAPESAGSLAYTSSVVSVAYDDGVVWGTDHASVVALDVSDPTHPLPLATQETPEWALHVAPLGDGTALVADWKMLERYALDRAIRSPDLELGRDTLYFSGGDEVATLELANRGGAALELSGYGLEDARFSLSATEAVAEPGESLSLSLSFTDDGEPVDTALCLATNDPDAPLAEVKLASTSEGSSIAVGEPAVDFVLPDVDGELHQLLEKRGQPILLSFFSTW